MKIDKKVINYIIFGIMTTAVNVITFYILDKLKIEYKINTTISNFISIIFAYVTNKIFVFESKSWEIKFIVKEMTKFFLSRLGTYFLDIFSMCIFVEIFLFNNMISKILANILVVVANYILSKFYIFREAEK